MNVRTEIPPELVEAYGATLFRCGDGSDAFVLRIGAYSATLADLYRSADVSSAAFLTAFNPKSEAQSADGNAIAHARLGAELAASGYRLVEGAGEDPDGLWPAEQSYLVLGIELEAGAGRQAQDRPFCRDSRKRVPWHAGCTRLRWSRAVSTGRGLVASGGDR